MPVADNQTLFQWLKIHEAERPDAVAVVSGQGSVSYGGLAAEVRCLAAGFAKAGIGEGDVIAAQLPNCREFVAAFLAGSARGAVFQTLHMPYRSKELTDLLAHSKAKTVMALANFKGMSPAAEILELKANLPHLETVIAVGGEVDGALTYDEVANATPDQTLIVETTPESPYLLLYTSGTTANPKGVPHNYRGFLSNALSSANELGLDVGSRILSLAACTHLYGLFTIHLALATGSTIAMLPAFDPATLKDDLAALKPTAIFAAPAHFAPFIAQGALTPDNFAAAELVCLSGTTVPPELAKAIDALLTEGSVIQLWGMSELQAGSFCRPDDPLEKRVSTAGRASLQTQLRVVDEAGDKLSAGEEGRLEANGPSVFGGYLDNPEQTKKSFTADGWFQTGDLAVIDADGYLILTGRTKEIINRGGVKYNPIEVEQIVLRHDAIASCAIVPVPDEVLGERACLCVQTTGDQGVELDEITALLEDSGVAKYKWPERLEIFEALPLTPTQKIMRGRLAQILKS